MKLLKSLLYYIIVIFLVLYILIVTFNPDKMMDVLGFRMFIVQSNSMEPKLNVNDMIFSKKVIEDDLETGDIITFQVYIPAFDSESYVTHYIGDIIEDGDETIIRTRGINLPEDEYDGWEDEDGNPINITFDDVEGEYIFKIPYIGYIQQAFNDKIILGLVMVNGGVIYLLYKMLKRGKRVN